MTEATEPKPRVTRIPCGNHHYWARKDFALLSSDLAVLDTAGSELHQLLTTIPHPADHQLSVRDAAAAAAAGDAN